MAARALAGLVAALGLAAGAPAAPGVTALAAEPGFRPLVLPGGEVALRPATLARAAVVNADGTWRRLLPGGVPVAVGPDGLRLGFAGAGRVVVAWTPSGAEAWRSPPLGLGPEASDRDIRVAADGSVYVTGAWGAAGLGADGRVRWTDRGGQGNQVQALALAPDGGVVYGLVGLDERPWLVSRAPGGAERWRVPLAGTAVGVALRDDGTALVAERRAGPSGTAALVAVGPAGAEAWRLPTGAEPPAGLAVAAGGRAYAVVARGIVRDGRVRSAGAVWAIEADGRVAWRHAGRPAAAPPLAARGGGVYVGGSPLTALRPDGRVRWTLPSGTPLLPRLVAPDGTLIAAPAPVFPLAGVVLAVPAGGPGPAPPAARALVSGLRPSAARVRASGPPSVCPRGRAGPCTPRVPRDAALRFRLRRDAVVTSVVRRLPGGTVAGRLTARLRSGTTWWSLATAAGFRRLAPGRYRVELRAAAGRERCTAAAALRVT